MPIRTAILTISDRAARGVYEDQGGPALQRAVAGLGWQVCSCRVVPDEKAEIQRAIRDFAADRCELVLSTGGTGISPRDVTPEAIREIASCELPGFGELMRRESLRITPHAILSRSLAAVVAQCLVICLPGKPTGAVECLGFVAAAIPHALEVLKESSSPHLTTPAG